MIILDYNKAELARETGLSRPTVSAILNGKQKNPKIETLDKISSALGCTVEALRVEIKRLTAESKKVRRRN